MATVTFRYRSKKPIAPITVRFLHRINENNDVDITSISKYFIQKVYWTKHHKLTRPRDIDIINKQTEVRKELLKIETFVINSFVGLDTLQQEQVNKQWLVNTLHTYYNPVTPEQEEPKLPTTLIEYIEVYKASKKNEVQLSTIKKLNVIKRKLERFQQENNNKPILIKDVNLNFKIEIENYMLKQGYAPNTIAREIKYIKAFCVHARKNGLETSSQLEDIKGKPIPITSIYLTKKEIELIIDKEDLNDKLKNIRSWFLISYYTGQRISDFLRFNMEMVRFEYVEKANKEIPLLEFTQKKTGKIMTVPVNQKLLKILQENPKPISEPKYNLYLKELCEEVGITQLVKGSKKLETKEGSGIYRKKEGVYKKCDLVSSHIGRRSFATNNYGDGTPTSSLMYITGHSTEEMFLTYIGKSNKTLAIESYNYLNNM